MIRIQSIAYPVTDLLAIYYTDSNGLEMQKRVLNQRPDYKLVTDMQVSSNYYPINSAIAFRDTKTNMQMTVMNDRS